MVSSKKWSFFGPEISVFGPKIWFLPFDPNFGQQPVCSPRTVHGFMEELNGLPSLAHLDLDPRCEQVGSRWIVYVKKQILKQPGSNDDLIFTSEIACLEYYQSLPDDLNPSILGSRESQNWVIYVIQQPQPPRVDPSFMGLPWIWAADHDHETTQTMVSTTTKRECYWKETTSCLSVSLMKNPLWIPVYSQRCVMVDRLSLEGLST